MNKMIRMLTKLIDNEKNKAGKFPKGKKAVEILNKNLDIVFDESELEVLYEFSFKGPTVDQSGSGLMCRIHEDDETALYAFALSGVQFSAVAMPDGFKAEMIAEGQEEESAEDKEDAPAEEEASGKDELGFMEPPEDLPYI